MSDPRDFSSVLAQREAEIAALNALEASAVDPLERTEPIRMVDTPQGIRVTTPSAAGRTIQQLLNLLCAQPIGSVSERLIEAAAGVSALQRENALLRMENEDLKLRLRAAGVQLP